MLQNNENTQTVPSSGHELVQMYEDRVQWKLAVDCVVVASTGTLELMGGDEEEEDEEVDDVEEGSSTEDWVPKQGPAPQGTIPVVPRIWAMGPSDELASRRPATSSKAWGKVPTIQAEPAPLAKTD